MLVGNWASLGPVEQEKCLPYVFFLNKESKITLMLFNMCYILK